MGDRLVYSARDHTLIEKLQSILGTVIKYDMSGHQRIVFVFVFVVDVVVVVLFITAVVVLICY